MTKKEAYIKFEHSNQVINFLIARIPDLEQKIRERFPDDVENIAAIECYLYTLLLDFCD